jgi:hypothetical protein
MEHASPGHDSDQRGPKWCLHIFGLHQFTEDKDVKGVRT